MKSYIKFLLIVFTAIIGFSGCEDRSELVEPQKVSTGTANFERYVAIGNSLTAGFQSGALFQSGQEYSFGNIISKQVGTEFVQPLYSDPGTPGRMEILSLSPFATKMNTNSGQPININYPKPYNNLGIPGALLYDVLNATSSTNSASGLVGSINPLFDVVLRGQGSQFTQAKIQAATFVTLWIGNNDVLGYATSGGVSPSSPTPTPIFQALYSNLMDSLASIGAKVVVGNMPNVTSIPFFTTVPAALRDPSGNIITLYGTTSTGVRALVPGQDLLTLLASSVLLDATGTPTGIGLTPSSPLPTNVILDRDEVVIASNAISQFNATINQLASAKGFPVVNMNSFFNNVAANGITVDGIEFSTTFVTGGLFSLDGVHPTSQGHGIVANEFIKTINNTFGASIPLVNVSTIPGSLPLAKGLSWSKYGIPLIHADSFKDFHLKL